MNRRAAIALILIAAVGAGLPAYLYGRITIARECPQRQQGEKLLYSEQRLDQTRCAYASGWDGHGSTIKRRGAGDQRGEGV